MKKFEDAELKLGKRIFERVKSQATVINWVLYISMAFGVLLAISLGLNLSRHFMEN
jgi:low temperature requirement protein LtrA